MGSFDGFRGRSVSAKEPAATLRRPLPLRTTFLGEARLAILQAPLKRPLLIHESTPRGSKRQLKPDRQPEWHGKMKSNIVLVLALLAGVLLAGCESSAKLNNIRIGMTKAEVQSILGTPDSTSAQANVEYMTYYLEAESGYGRDQPYMIRLVNGRVESFGRFAQLFDLYNRPVTTALPGQPDFPQPAYNMGNPLLPPPTVVRTDSPAVRVDLAAELQQLKALKDQGVLTDEEFQKAKAKLLSQP
jgi:hypothetical protein